LTLYENSNIILAGHACFLRLCLSFALDRTPVALWRDIEKCNG